MIRKLDAACYAVIMMFTISSIDTHTHTHTHTHKKTVEAMTSIWARVV